MCCYLDIKVGGDSRAENKTSEAQLKAAKKWNDKNKDKQRVYRYRSYARKFIRDLATDNDLKELQEMIQERLNN